LGPIPDVEGRLAQRLESAQLRRTRPRSAMSGLRRFETCSSVSNAQIAVIAGRVANGSNRPFVHFKICPVNAREARESGLWLNGGLGQPTVPERIRSSQSARSHSVRVPSAAARSAAPNVRRQLQRPAPSPFASPDKRHPLRGSKASSRTPATNRDRISNGVATKSATVSGRRSRACRQSRHSRRSESGATDSQIWRCTVYKCPMPVAKLQSTPLSAQSCWRRRHGGRLATGRGGGQKAGLVITTSRPTRGWNKIDAVTKFNARR
jgi:hypothetical protein